MDTSRSNFRHQSAPKDREEELGLAFIRLAKKYGRYGYRKIATPDSEPKIFEIGVDS